MNASLLEEILEATLLAAGEPLALERLEGVFSEAERPQRRELRAALQRLEQRHASGALELMETASGYQLRIRPRLSPWVSRLWDERPQRYSRALLETLALIAYRQPVTRGDIEDVRGVSVSSSIVRTLMERGWIRVIGHRDVPGRPAVYATTRTFLDDFGLKTLDALPPMHLLLDDIQSKEALDKDDQAKEKAFKDEVSAPVETPTAEIADTQHAEMASTSPLSFADLQARLAARAGTSVDDDTSAGDDNPEVRSDDHEYDN
ncbi:SMC-Scp complex subunit ScpB [Halomonas sp. ZH2S]|uniref:SMC-Scp complex subunit ScpB n=1 Tax=Vreelandella zhuhanensis TaxID=2684210 RepID=A0A7X3H3C9_9GAMM|nr:SMC-Scp complex subunit ScpB [Halomonas zhuhanensis]MWJ28720.1 SMC-Scp complex subunit ScpB [Halomonas zhuhanensis]